jgi:hypothetical protein
MPSGRGFINDAQLSAVDRIHAIDDAHVGFPCPNQIHDIIAMRMQELGTVFIRGIELSDRSGRDLSQCGRPRIDEGNAQGSIREHIAKGDRYGGGSC